MRLIKAFLVFLVLSGLSTAHAMDVVLQWDANTEPDLAGYKVYQADRDGDHTGPWAKVAEVTTNTHTLTVPDGQNFAWLVTAFDTSGNESFVSNMVELMDRTPPYGPKNLGK